jgi:hypothetical protein
MSCLRYLCLFVQSGVHHILYCVFALLFFVLCTLCCQFLWIVHFLLSLRYSLAFIYRWDHSSSRPHDHKTFEYTFRTRIPKLSNQQQVIIWNSVLIGWVQANSQINMTVRSEYLRKQNTVMIMVFNATFNNISLISWWSVLYWWRKPGVLGENQRPAASYWRN